MLLPVAPSPATPAPADAGAPERLQAVIGGCLGIDLAGVDPRTPLTACGLDSLKALEVVGALEDAYGCTLPEWLLLDCPDLATLADAIDRLSGGDDARTTSTTIHADAVLPADIVPAGPVRRQAGVRCILLTGATGFLGAWLARTLLDRTDARLVCLARSSSSEPADRVRQNLDRYGLWRPGDALRVHGVAGDLSRPSLGIEPSAFQALAGAVEAIFHAGADVNWVTPYAGLRSANVSGTVELLRLACIGSPKPFHFVSSLAVCYAVGGPAEVVEAADMLPWAEQLPLGYAQSKCVAEALIREAARRGLPATIFRPALLAGDSSTGASNVDDLIGSLLKGCIQMQAAPDLDWTFDAAPVDVAAQAIVRIATAPFSVASSPPGLQTFHLRHPRPRHWRECLLWANLFGYDLRLEPYSAWLRRLDREAHRPGHPLHRLRSFFLRHVEGRTVPEHYQADSRSQVDCSEAQRAEYACGLQYPPLDADLLHRYFEDYIRRGYLPPPPRRARSMSKAAPAPWQSAAHFERLLRTSLADPTLCVTSLERVGRGSDHSVVSELTAWRRGQQSGLFHYRLGLRQRDAARTVDVMVKVKPSDQDVLEVAETMAAVCDARVSATLRHVRDLIGIRGSHLREPALYDEANDCLRSCMPKCFGTWRDEDGTSCGIVLERLRDLPIIDAVDRPDVWTEHAIQSVIAGLATIHAVWLGREAELREKPWIGHVPEPDDASRLQPFWEALASHAAPHFRDWAGAALLRTHDGLVESASQWWRRAFDGHPRTLLHNDFNPRNIALREDAGRLRLVAYDWELATIGVPQRDLAEFLCFVLPEDVSLARVSAALDGHRGQLEHLSGTPLDTGRWRAGFADALSEVLVARLAFYALIDRVRPQPFLPRVVRTWLRLHTLSSQWSVR